MILDRTWNKYEQKLVISYIDKQGNRKFYQKYFHHFKTYEYDENGEFDTWDGKRCNRVFKDTTTYTPNEFDLLEYMYEMDPAVLKELHAQHFPKIYTFDIETEVSDVFPDPALAEQKVTAISLVGPDLSCIVYGLHNLTMKQKDLFAERYREWLDNNEFAKNIRGDKEIKVLYQYFETEEELLKHFFTIIVPKVPVLAGWNSYQFDWQYLTNRLKRLFGDAQARNIIRKSSPTGETRNIRYEESNGLHGNVTGPCHTLIMDYMKLVEKYDRVIDPKESLGLDWIASHPKCVKAHKIAYNGTLQQLYERDPEWYYFYNAVDSLIVMLIHYRLKCIESPCAVSSVTLVPTLDAMGQVALTTANVFEEFYNDNKKVVYDYDAVERYKVNYEGAFCGCEPGRYEWNVCDDFASLYPSQIQTCNLSFENFYQKKVGPDSLGRYVVVPWTEDELEAFRKDENYFVSDMGNVYKNDKDYAFKKLQRRIKKNRDKYKYTGNDIDSQLLVEIDRLLKESA